jgi:hypothetical protein
VPALVSFRDAVTREAAPLKAKNHAARRKQTPKWIIRCTRSIVKQRPPKIHVAWRRQCQPWFLLEMRSLVKPRRSKQKIMRPDANRLVHGFVETA